ncbi:MAG: retropepsin-like domain-containing protein [Muribaculaceae bacterium]|nr:retropepsin-like domain-containing protein [Muribaculaceae bacterium]
MRKIILSVIVSILSLASFAQTIDNRIAHAMNSGDWFALDSIYNAVPKDSIMPFLEVYSRALIGNRLNRPDVSIPAFGELLNNHSENLDLGNLLNSTVMLSMDLSKEGNNAKAAEVVASVLDATRQYLDSTAMEGMHHYIDKYTALSAYNPYDISFTDREGCVPFKIVPVGNIEKKAFLMQLDDSSINGKRAAITFDTGAGVNIISDSLARSYDLIPINAFQSMSGIGELTGQYAIAKELTIGNIAIRDVPFLIVDLTLDNEEANKYIDCFSIVLGSELMLRLNDLTIDFIKRQITVPSIAPKRSGIPANMYFSNQMNLITNGEVHNNKMQICIDTGDASFGALNGDFFKNNKDYVLANAQPDTVRMAGIGGVRILECYRLPEVLVGIGGNEVVIPHITVNTGLNPLATDYECNLGLKSLMQFGKIHFNMIDFTITTYPTKLSAIVSLERSAPTFKFTQEKPSFLQSIGIVALSIANGLLNVNAPSDPDL